MMYILKFVFAGAIAAAAVILPAMLILHFTAIRSLRRSFACTLFALYLGAVGAVVQLPHIAKMCFQPRLHLIPIAGIPEDFVNSVLNILLFLPLGVFLPFLYERFKSAKNVAVYGFLMSLSIELLQLFNAGITDVNDLIMNTLGAVLGYLLWKNAARKLTGKGGENDMSKASRRELAAISITALAAAVTVQPTLRGAVLKALGG